MGRAQPGPPVPSGPPHRASHPGPLKRDRRQVTAAVRAVVEAARARGRTVLTEPEAQAVLAAVGIASPPSVFVRGSDDAAGTDLSALATDRVVVKAVAPDLLHKTERGAVAIVPRDAHAVAEAIAIMARRLDDLELDGFLVSEFVTHDNRLGGELLASVRWTPDYGPVVSVGAGGIDAEALAGDLRSGREIAILSPDFEPAGGIAPLLQRATAVRLATTSLRGQAPRADIGAVVAVVEGLMALADAAMPALVSECEINPLVLDEDGRPVALDVLLRIGDGRDPVDRVEPPLDKLPHLLEPRTFAVVGVSERQNIGHIILGNLLRDGIEPSRITVVKPGAEQLDGCACVPDVAALPGRVDLLVVAVSADQAPDVVAEAVAHEAAESIIIIPGGIGETPGSEPLAQRIRQTLVAARMTPGRGPLVNGGNCLGIRSRPGGYDTMFIPETKLAAPSGRAAPLAIIAQSGGFALARLSRIEGVNPKYTITVGNQLDLTASDYLAYLKDDPEITVFAAYVEGFAPHDGLRFMRLAREITGSGRAVILYQAGRTQAGARAAASHTASIAGDAVVTRALAGQAGIVMADSLMAFDALVRMFAVFEERRPAGRRIGAVTNAGYESVAIADLLNGLRMAVLAEETDARLHALLAEARLTGVVEVHNPLDLTPMADDATYEGAVRALLDDPGVDVGVVGIVPFTTALQTLPAGVVPGEDVASTDSVAGRLVRVWEESTKPWLVVVDAGPRYDPLATQLAAAGIPVFRSADAALRTLAAVCAATMAA